MANIFSSRVWDYCFFSELTLSLCYQSQADWKRESADKFGDIAELVKSVGSLKLEEEKSQGSSLDHHVCSLFIIYIF